MAATKKNHRIKEQLALATCSLLSQQAGAIESNWTFDSSLAFYSETDRVSVSTGMIDLSGTLTEGNKIDVSAVYDTMTGSTPTGSVENSTVQTQTGVSGSGGFDSSGAPTSLAPFEDTRLAVKFNWEHENSGRFRTTYGGSSSVEKDYTSLGYSFGIALDSSSKLTTYEFGFAGAFDTISQTGGSTPDPLGDVTNSETYGEGHRNSYDLLFGITNILSPSTLWQNNITFSVSDGYHTDPYKVISVVGNEQDRQALINAALQDAADSRSVNVADLPADVVAAITRNFDAFEVEFTRLYESRPDKRRRTSWYSKLVTRLANNQTIHLSYRYYTDDWDVTSHTIDYRHTFKMGDDSWTFEPQVRAYQQSAADFFHRSLVRGESLPEYASADNRLDEVVGATVAVKFGKQIGDNGEVRFRIAGIAWRAEEAVYDETDAILFQVSMRLGF
ncbi:MAG: DUF3570 domain-containing protein [Gammaproteobacteria bacterium]|nr:DUF3570 domain-containing protein [Gammaproteobacteria bacterium]